MQSKARKLLPLACHSLRLSLILNFKSQWATATQREQCFELRKL